MADDTGAIPVMPAVDTTATSGTLDAILKAPKATYYGPESKAALEKLLALQQERANTQPTLLTQALQNASTWLQPTRTGSLGEAIGNAMTSQRELGDIEFKRRQEAGDLALKIAQMNDAATRQGQVQALIDKAYDQETGRIDQTALRKLMVLDQPAAASIIAMDKAMRGERVLGKDQMLIATNPSTGATSIQFNNTVPEYKEFEQGGARFRYDTRNPTKVEYFTPQGWATYAGSAVGPSASPVAPPNGGPLPSAVPLPAGTPQATTTAPKLKVNKSVNAGVDAKNRTVGGLTREQFIQNAVASGQADERVAGAMFDNVLPPVGSTIMRPGAEKDVWTEVALSKAPQSMSAPSSTVPGALTAPEKPDSESARYQSEQRQRWLSDPMVRENVARAGAFQTVKQLVNKPNPSGADDAALIIQFNKLLDPSSVVREAEFARTGNFGGLIEGIQRYVTGKIEGTALTPLQRKELLGATEHVIKGHVDSLDNYAKTYLQALRSDPFADPKQIIIDPYQTVRKELKAPESSAPRTAPSAGKTRSGVTFSNW